MALGRVVVATTWSGLSVSNSIRTCAERRLLERLARVARTRGVASHRIVHFVRREVKRLFITRMTRGGEETCSLPCLLCRRELEAHHIRWQARDWDGVVTEETAGESTLTHRQRAQFSVVRL